MSAYDFISSALRGEVEYDPKITGLFNHPTIVQHPAPASVDWGTAAASEIMLDFAEMVSALRSRR